MTENGAAGARQTVPAAQLGEFRRAAVYRRRRSATCLRRERRRGLVEADLEGLQFARRDAGRHVYRASAQGSVRPRRKRDRRFRAHGAVVLDAGHALGQLTGAQAMSMAIDKARQFAAGIVSVRHGFHFGAAGRYALQAAEAGLRRVSPCAIRAL